jgi:hypothetical protein
MAPGAPGISTVDVVAVQRHFLNVAPLPAGCALAAADVNADMLITTADIIAIQRFILTLSTGTANVGTYQFTPASRTYPGVVSDQTGQNYDALVFGDVVSPFAEQQQPFVREVQTSNNLGDLPGPTGVPQKLSRHAEKARHRKAAGQ